MSLISGNFFYIAPTEAEPVDASMLIYTCPANKSAKITSYIIADSSSPAVAYTPTLFKISGKNAGLFPVFKATLDAGDIVDGGEIRLTSGESLKFLSTLNNTTSIIFSGEEAPV